METLLLTGGAGFIGSNLVRWALNHTPWRVVVVDKLTYAGHAANLADVSGHALYAFVQADIADRAAMDALFSQWQPRYVVNCAAETHVDRSIDEPLEFVKTNVLGTGVLLEAARLYLQGRSGQERAKFRFLHLSTDEVYGTVDGTGAFKESSLYAPNSPYAASKAGADHLIRAYYQTYRLPVLLTNCSNNYGPHQFPEKLIPLMILNAVEGKPLPIYGDGRQIRDWLYVEDHCEAILRVLEAGTLGQKYHIGAGEQRTNLEIVQEICAILERFLPARENHALIERGIGAYTNLQAFVQDRPGHDRHYAMDASKLTRELDWKPRYDLSGALAQTVQWYLDHLDWCQTVQAGRYDRQRLGVQPVASYGG